MQNTSETEILGSPYGTGYPTVLRSKLKKIEEQLGGWAKNQTKCFGAERGRFILH